MARSILITGCSSGIGRCAADGMQARGWQVFATARKPEDIEMPRQPGDEPPEARPHRHVLVDPWDHSDGVSWTLFSFEVRARSLFRYAADRAARHGHPRLSYRARADPHALHPECARLCAEEHRHR